jgi:hypothetical protein
MISMCRAVSTRAAPVGEPEPKGVIRKEVRFRYPYPKVRNSAAR